MGIEIACRRMKHGHLLSRSQLDLLKIVVSFTVPHQILQFPLLILRNPPYLQLRHFLPLPLHTIPRILRLPHRLPQIIRLQRPPPYRSIDPHTNHHLPQHHQPRNLLKMPLKHVKQLPTSPFPHLHIFIPPRSDDPTAPLINGYSAYIIAML